VCVSLNLVTYVSTVDRIYPLRKQANGTKRTAIWVCVKLLYYSVTSPSYLKQPGGRCELIPFYFVRVAFLSA
jgi:hypothetical protein